MSFKILGVRIEISFLLITMLTLFSFYDKSGIALCAFFAALLHESGHIIAAAICSCGIYELAFKPFGIRMKLKKPLALTPTKRKIFILSAGCIVNVICFVCFSFFSRKITDAALIHLITAIFNLLPAGTLDGGRILYELLSIKMGQDRAEILCDVISLVFAAALFIFGGFVLVKTGYNLSLIVTATYLFIMVIARQKKLK